MLLFGEPYLGYDASFSLIWGSEIAAGELPDLDALRTAPTPHPLANLLGALLSPLGDDAPRALALTSALSFGALGMAALALGARLFSAPVGILFSFLLLTRPRLVEEALFSSLDIPALALILAAAALVAGRSSAWPVLGLLGLAGLLRPEAWLLSVAYAAFRLGGSDRRESVRLVAAATAAPLIWAASDLVATGDPLYSLHGTRDLSMLLGRPRGFSSALETAPIYLRWLLGWTLTLGGCAGCLIGLRMLYRRSLLPAAILGLGLVGFCVLGLAGLPLLFRFVLFPGTMLVLFCAVAIAGWPLHPRSERWHATWVAGAAAGAVAVAASLPGAFESLREVKRTGAEIRRSHADLRQLAGNAVRDGWVADCPIVQIDRFLNRPVLSHALKRDPSFVTTRELGSRQPGLVITGRRDPAPPGRRRVAANRTWTLYARC